MYKGLMIDFHSYFIHVLRLQYMITQFNHIKEIYHEKNYFNNNISIRLFDLP
jgi:hypothetical protein